MHTSLDCIPCFVRQALEAARFSTDDEAVHERVLRDVLRASSEFPLDSSPVAMGQAIHRLIRRLTGDGDPYRRLKDRFNRVVLGLYPELKARVERADDPLEAAVRLAIAGNTIDAGIHCHLDEAGVHAAIEHGFAEPLLGDVAELRDAVDAASRVLYLADNAGEIVCDRLLIERLGPARITVAVKGHPVLNDATRADAEAVGLTALVEVIDNGSDAPGTILDDCSEAFRRRFAEADLVLAKGQGNYEGLSSADADIFFILKAKCPVIACDLGCRVGGLILRRHRPAVLAPG